jgi:hypothetical protein
MKGAPHKKGCCVILLTSGPHSFQVLGIFLMFLSLFVISNAI